MIHTGGTHAAIASSNVGMRRPLRKSGAPVSCVCTCVPGAAGLTLLHPFPLPPTLPLCTPRSCIACLLATAALACGGVAIKRTAHPTHAAHRAQRQTEARAAPHGWGLQRWRHCRTSPQAPACGSRATPQPRPLPARSSPVCPAEECTRPRPIQAPSAMVNVIVPPCTPVQLTTHPPPTPPARQPKPHAAEAPRQWARRSLTHTEPAASSSPSPPSLAPPFLLLRPPA